MVTEGKEWLYFFVEAATGKTWAFDNGLIVTKGAPTPLLYTPDGWQDISLAWERNMNMHGVNRSFSLSLLAVMDGAEILRHIIYTKNFEERIYLLIKRQKLFLDAGKYYFWYKYFYRGEIDLTTAKDNSNGTFSFNLMQGGVTNDLKANFSTRYDISIGEAGYYYIKMDGVRLISTMNFDCLDGFRISNNDYSNHICPVIYQSEDGVSAEIDKKTSYVEAISGNEIQYLKDSSNWITRNTSLHLIEHKIKARIGVKCVSNITGGGLSFRFMTSSQTQANQGLYTFAPAYNPAIGQINWFDVDMTIPLESQDKLYLRGVLISPTGAREVAYEFMPDSYIHISIENTFPHTYIKALKPKRLFEKLTEKLTGYETKCSSALLEDHANLMLTSGDALRGLDGPMIKTNMSDFFAAFDAVLCAGMGVVNEKIEIEDREHYYKNENVIHLGKAKSVTGYYLNDEIFANIKIGYNPQDNNDVNGRNEPNTTQIYTSVVKKSSKTYEQISPYRAGPIDIELTRINLDGKTTTDSSSDNDTFIINVDPVPKMLDEQDGDMPAGVPYYELKREVYDSITGLISPESIFNIEELTPKRLLLKHGPWIRGILSGFETTELTFQSQDKNRSLRTVKGDSIIDEDVNVFIGSLGTPYVKPWVFDIEIDGMVDLAEMLETNPNRCFSFEHPNGRIYKGFNIKIGQAPNSMEEQSFQLLSTFDNDLTTLKNG